MLGGYLQKSFLEAGLVTVWAFGKTGYAVWIEYEGLSLWILLGLRGLELVVLRWGLDGSKRSRPVEDHGQTLGFPIDTV